MDELYLDQKVVEHLSQCSPCARLVSAEGTLRRDLATVGNYMPTTPLPLSRVRENLEARINVQRNHQPILTKLLRHGGRIMNLAKNQMSRKPKLSLSFGMLFFLAVIAVTVPFNIGQTVEYQVALAAVSHDLAPDTERLREVLASLNITEAEIDVSDCDPSCRVLVSKLKSLSDVQIVLAAVDRMGNYTVEDVSKTRNVGKNTLVEFVGENLLIETEDEQPFESVSYNFNDETNKLEVNLDLKDGNYTLWTRGNEDGNEYEKIMTVERNGDSNLITMQQKMEIRSEELLANASMSLIDPFGSEHVFYFDNPAHRALLEKMGFDFEKVAWKTGKPQWTEEIISDDPAANSAVDGQKPSGNYPNPFNPSTTICFTLAQTEHVNLDICNITGQKVRQLTSEIMSSGEHTIEWDGKDDAGSRVASGVYFYRLETESMVQSKKMILLK